VSSEYRCDKCGKEVEFDDLGYLGSPDNTCSPFMKLDCFCKDCYEEADDS
jgi:hypothetical protein